MKIAVVGDVLLDADFSGPATRLCPDAPVPVVDVETVQRRAGGAGLVARMLVRDGADVDLVTVLSDDDAAAQLREQLGGMNVVSGPSGAPTPVKSRIRAQGQAVVRFDEGCAPAPVPAVTAEMLDAVASADAVVVADYGRGLAENTQLRGLLAEVARRTPVVWDPHPSGAEPVPGVAAVTPNLAEALQLAKALRAAADSGNGGNGGKARNGSNGSGGVQAAADAAESLGRHWGSNAVVVTLGGQGALISTGRGLPQVLPAPRTQVDDPCGAGDRFSSALALSLARGHDLQSAAETAVREAAAYLAAGGVASLTADVAPPQLHGGSIDALRVAEETRKSGGTVVATGGCFDLLHAGHARTLSAARGVGDCLIVCLNSDSSVRRLKGEDRPIMDVQDRHELLLALECVDAVLVFDEDTPEAALEQLRPDVWVKGGDYTADELPESRLLETWGGRTVTVPYYPARSTTHLAAALAEVG